MSAGPAVDLAPFQSVLLVKPSSLGDIVHALPAAHFIKQAHPHLRLRWLCNPEWMPLLEGNPDLAEVIPFPRGELRGMAAPLKFLLWARQLNAAPRELPEIILDLPGPDAQRAHFSASRQRPSDRHVGCARGVGPLPPCHGAGGQGRSRGGPLSHAGAGARSEHATGPGDIPAASRRTASRRDAAGEVRRAASLLPGPGQIPVSRMHPGAVRLPGAPAHRHRGTWAAWCCLHRWHTSRRFSIKRACPN